MTVSESVSVSVSVSASVSACVSASVSVSVSVLQRSLESGQYYGDTELRALSLIHTRTHARTHARTHTHTHTRSALLRVGSTTATQSRSWRLTVRSLPRCLNVCECDRARQTERESE